MNIKIFSTKSIIAFAAGFVVLCAVVTLIILYSMGYFTHSYQGLSFPKNITAKQVKDSLAKGTQIKLSSPSQQQIIDLKQNIDSSGWKTLVSTSLPDGGSTITYSFKDMNSFMLVTYEQWNKDKKAIDPVFIKLIKKEDICKVYDNIKQSISVPNSPYKVDDAVKAKINCK